MKSTELSAYLNELLNVPSIQDAALNGLQVENEGEIHKIGLAVDVSYELILKAVDSGVDFLLVHHGLFWGKPETISGGLYRRIRALIQGNIALYAVHLPLDAHDEFGNNAQIKDVLKWPVTGDFGAFQGLPLGKEVRFEPPRPLETVTAEIKSALNTDLRIWKFGKETVHRLGFISGGGIGFLDQVAEAGIDTLLTGEPRHGAYWPAKEAGINVILAGHYATETLGVKALGQHIREKFGIEAVFLDLPTGY